MVCLIRPPRTQSIKSPKQPEDKFSSAPTCSTSVQTLPKSQLSWCLPSQPGLSLGAGIHLPSVSTGHGGSFALPEDKPFFMPCGLQSIPDLPPTFLSDAGRGQEWGPLQHSWGSFKGSRGDIRPAPVSLHPLPQAHGFKILSAHSSLKQFQGS